MCEARGKREYFRNNFNLGRAPAEEGRGSSVSEGSRGEGGKVGKGSVWRLCEIMPMSQSSSTIFGGTTKHQVTMLKDRGVFARQYYRQRHLKLSYCLALLYCCQETLEYFLLLPLFRISPPKPTNPPNFPHLRYWFCVSSLKTRGNSSSFFQESRALAQSWGNGVVASSDGELSRKFK